MARRRLPDRRRSPRSSSVLGRGRVGERLGRGGRSELVELGDVEQEAVGRQVAQHVSVALAPPNRVVQVGEGGVERLSRRFVGAVQREEQLDLALGYRLAGLLVEGAIRQDAV